MLILGRKVGDSILIGDDIKVVVLANDRGGVRIGIDAPKGVTILRGEIVSDVTAENQRAGASDAAGTQEWLKVIGGLKPDPPSASASVARPPPPSEQPFRRTSRHRTRHRRQERPARRRASASQPETARAPSARRIPLRSGRW